MNVLAANDFVASLQQAIAPLANETPLSLELGAEIANTSPRTLRRWLALQGTTWRQIVDRVRFEACERRILESSLTITEISADLGYSDQAHFTRAFHRWTGEAPSAYRRRRLSYALDLRACLSSHDGHEPPGVSSERHRQPVTAILRQDSEGVFSDAESPA